MELKIGDIRYNELLTFSTQLYLKMHEPSANFIHVLEMH